MSKVILYIATSKDGFITDKNGGIDWLPQPDNIHEDVDDILRYKALMKRISIIAMGSKSYIQTVGFGDWMWNDKTTYVFTSQPLTTSNNAIKFTNTSPTDFIKMVKKQGDNQDIWLFGGALLIASFAKEQLIDECMITVVSAILGEGIKLELPYDDFILTDTKIYSDNIVQNVYTKKKTCTK